MYRVIVDTREVVIQKKLDQAWIDGYEFAGIANGVIIMKLRQDKSEDGMADEGIAAVLDEIVAKMNDLEDQIAVIREGDAFADESFSAISDRLSDVEESIEKLARISVQIQEPPTYGEDNA